MSNATVAASTSQTPSASILATERRSSSSQEDIDESETPAQPRGVKRSAPSQGRTSSCAECRRLKLKCDRGTSDSWPCVQCRRRKCSELCPGSVSMPTAKAGNERLLRHYRSKIADLEARLSVATGPPTADSAGVASDVRNLSQLNEDARQARSVASQSSTLSNHASSSSNHFEAQDAPSNANGIGESRPSHVDAANEHRFHPSNAPPLVALEHDDEQQEPPVAIAVDSSTHQLLEPVDTSIWSEESSSQAPPRLAQASQTVPPASTGGSSRASFPPVLDNEAATQPSLPSGPTYYGRAAGAFYRQAETGTVS